MPRTGSTFMLAIVVIFLLYTLTVFPPDLALDQFSTKDWGDDSLQGAVDDPPTKSKPPVTIAYDQSVDEDPTQPTPEDGTQRQRFPEQFRTFQVPSDIVYPKDGPEPDQVVMLMASDGQGHNNQIPHLFERVVENRKQYAKLHGYHFHFINTTKYDLGRAHAVWSKLPSIVDTFNRFPSSQWIWWLDSDAVIMTPQIDLNSHLLSPKTMGSRIEKNMRIKDSDGAETEVYTTFHPDVSQIDIIISQDHLGLNAGSFFIRRSTTAKWIMDMWADPMFIKAGWTRQEQEALLRMVLNHESVRAHIGYVPQRLINAYAVGSDEMKWSPGDFVVHFAGCWVDSHCAVQFEELWSQRKTVEDLEEVRSEEDKTGRPFGH